MRTTTPAGPEMPAATVGRGIPRPTVGRVVQGRPHGESDRRRGIAWPSRDWVVQM